jgi:CO/xanthine dehydrogenase Mo-binding subunit
MSSGVDKAAPRPDIVEKVTGTAQFVSDVALPGMLHARLLRSPHPHARIRSVDASAALAMPGVIGVLTGADIAGLNYRWGLYLRDRPLIAVDRARYVGDPVAAVIAEDEFAAEEALDAIAVDYEELPWVTEAEDAIAPGAPLIHERHDTIKDFYFRGETKPVAGTNVYQDYAYAQGDVDAAFAAADHVFEDSFRFPMVFHYALEPHCVVADWDGKNFTLWSCAQSPGAAQKVIAQVFGVPQARVRIIVPYVGGGFGGKASVKLDPLAAALAWKVGRPVRLCLSISESMLTARRLSATIRLKTGVRSDGTILGKSVRVLMNGGAYADTGPAVAIKAANRAIGPYRIPNLSLTAQAAYTNTVPGAAFRSIGGPQAVWATETQMDRIAQALGIDPIELRHRNLLARGEPVRADLRPIDVDMAEALGLVSQSLGRSGPGAGRGRGVALGASDPGIMAVASATVRIQVDGSVLVLANSVEIGQGVRAVLAQVAADALKQPLESIHVAQPDTLTAPFDWGTGASRSTVIMGLAVEDAAADARKKLAALAADMLGVAPEDVSLIAGGIAAGDRRLSFRDLLHQAYGVDSGEVTGHATVTPRYRNGDFARQPLFWETAAGGCEIDLDEETGEIFVRRYVSVADVGRVMNRSAAEGQDEGAAMQGIGHGLFEELIYVDGQPVNANLFDYHVPTIDEAPAEFRTVLIESGTGPGPGGARGMGEGAILPPAPAIANALASLHGVRVTELPMTPERVWRALRDKSAGPGEAGAGSPATTRARQEGRG